MKKILLIIMVVMLMVPVVNAGMEWDNVLDYKDDDMTLEITNWLGLGEKLGEATLTSHNTPTEIRNVIGGEDRAVMWYDFNFEKGYKEGLGEVSFIDLKTGRNIERDYHFAKAVYKIEQYPEEYVEDCNVNPDIGFGCGNRVVKWRNETVLSHWEKLDTTDIPKEPTRIALITDVRPKDYVDGIWTIAGKKVAKHAGWNESFSLGLLVYWDLNQSVAYDQLGAYNMTNGSGVTSGQSGINGTAYHFDGTSNGWLNTTGTPENDEAVGTISCWANTTATDTDTFITMSDRSGTDMIFMGIRDYSGDDIEIIVRDGGTENQILFTNTSNSLIFDDGSWHHYVVVQNSSDAIRTYYDGQWLSVVDYGGDFGNTAWWDDMVGDLDNVELGRSFDAGSPARTYVGNLDECAIWNRTLSDSEILELSKGMTRVPEGDAVPTVTVNTPANPNHNATKTITFNATATDDVGVLNLTLTLGNGTTYTVTNTSADSGVSLEKSYEFVDGLYSNYTFTAYDTAPQSTTTAIRYFNITATVNVVLNTPSANTNHTSAVTFNCSADDPNQYIDNLTLYIDGASNTTVTGGAGNNLSLQTSTTLPDGDHNWTCRAYNNLSQTTMPGVRNFTYDTSAPVITITSPNRTYGYGKEDYNLSAIWTVTDADSSVNTCIYQYNNTNTTVTCGDNNVSFGMDKGEYEFILWANDSLNNAGSTTVTWSFIVWENNNTYSEPVIEGSINPFTVNIDYLASFSTITAYINYNNTQTLATRTGGGVTNVVFNSTGTAPAINADTNMTFFWNWSAYNGTYNYVQSNTSKQLVKNLTIDDCTTGTAELYNFSLVDEGTQLLVNGTANATEVNVHLEVYPYQGSSLIAEYYQNYTQNNNPKICFNIYPQSVNFTVDLQVGYDGTNYAPELYHLQQSTVRNSSFPQNITLYDLLDKDSQEFKITYKDENFLAVEDALVQIQRKYIEEGVFKTVEQPKTDAQGEALGHFQLGNTVYTIIFTKDGTVLGTFDNVIPICQNPTVEDCVINLNSFASAIEPETYTTGDDFAYTMSYNKATRNLGVIYSVPSGATATVLLNVTLIQASGNTSACSDTLITPSGTLNCSIPTTVGNGTAIAKITKDGVMAGVAMIDLRQTPSSLYGGSLIFIGLILVVSIVGLGVSNNPMITAVFGLVGAGMLVAMNLLDTGTSSFIGAGATILWLVIAIVIILIKGSKRI